MTAWEHVRYLTDCIGPRGSTREGEFQAARYAAHVLGRLGLEPVTEFFSSARSKYHPFALSTGIGLFCVMLFWLGGQLLAGLALALQLFNLVSVLLQLCSLNNPLRRLLPRGRSQNVYARIAPREEMRRRVVLLAHLDSNRTPLVNSNSVWFRVYGWLLPASLVSALILLVLFAWGLTGAGPDLRLVAIGPAVILLAVGLLMLQADCTPFTVGANDNASAVGVTLSIASRLVREPLRTIEVWAVLDGCEEVSLYGADAFARAHGAELGDALWIALDSIGGAAGVPRYTESETLLLTVHSDPELVRIFDAAARAHPELQAGPLPFHTGANATDGTMLGRRGLRQIAIVAPGPSGSELHQIHRITDDLEHIDVQVMDRCETLVWLALQRIDQSAQ